MNKSSNTYGFISTFEGGLRGMYILFLFLFSVSLFSQEDDPLGTEVVNVVKPYSPTISDAFKIKETPVLNEMDSLPKKEVRYEIFSVPVASTFTPSKGKAATVDKAKPITLYDNYATLGFGTYTSILGELFSSFNISRTDNAGLFFRHSSSQGSIEDVRLDNSFYDTELSGNYNSRQKDMSYKLEAGFLHQTYNWYGLNSAFDSVTDESLMEINPSQTYFGINLGGNLSFEESLFKGVSGTVHYLGDAFSSSEINLNIQPKFAFPLSDFTLKVDSTIDYLTGSFDRDYFNITSIDYSFLNAGISPSLVIVKDDLSLSLGAEAVANLDTENNETNFFIYPNINVSYRLLAETLIVYGGVDGGLKQNTYREFKNENPFVSPTLLITPTNQVYETFGGLKGKISNQVGYNIRGSYGKQKNRALFQLNPYKGMNSNFEGYEYGNSFGVIYDDIIVLNVFGELKVAVANSFSLGISTSINSFTLNEQPEAWNLPALEASIFSSFDITEKIYGGVSLFYVGERKDLQTQGTSQVITLDAFFDANINFGYRLNDRLSFFAKGSNLLGNNYEKWQNFPVQGIQGLLGATYKFDW